MAQKTPGLSKERISPEVEAKQKRISSGDAGPETRENRNLFNLAPLYTPFRPFKYSQPSLTTGASVPRTFGDTSPSYREMFGQYMKGMYSEPEFRVNVPYNPSATGDSGTAVGGGGAPKTLNAPTKVRQPSIDIGFTRRSNAGRFLQKNFNPRINPGVQQAWDLAQSTFVPFSADIQSIDLYNIPGSLAGIEPAGTFGSTTGVPPKNYLFGQQMQQMSDEYLNANSTARFDEEEFNWSSQYGVFDELSSWMYDVTSGNSTARSVWDTIHDAGGPYTAAMSALSRGAQNLVSFAFEKPAMGYIDMISKMPDPFRSVMLKSALMSATVMSTAWRLGYMGFLVATNKVQKLTEALVVFPAIVQSPTEYNPSKFWGDLVTREKRPLMYDSNTGQWGYHILTIDDGWKFVEPGKVDDVLRYESFKIDTDSAAGFWGKRQYDFNRVITNDDGSIRWDLLFGTTDKLGSMDLTEATVEFTGITGIAFSLAIDPWKFDKFIENVDNDIPMADTVMMLENSEVEFWGGMLTDPTNIIGNLYSNPYDLVMGGENFKKFLSGLGDVDAKAMLKFIESESSQYSKWTLAAADRWITQSLWPTSRLLDVTSSNLVKLFRTPNYGKMAEMLRSAYKNESTRNWFIRLSKRSHFQAWTGNVTDALKTLSLRYDPGSNISVPDFFQRALLGDDDTLRLLGERQRGVMKDLVGLLRDYEFINLNDLIAEFGSLKGVSADVIDEVIERISNNPVDVVRIISHATEVLYAKQLGIEYSAKGSLFRALNYAGALFKEAVLSLNMRYMVGNFITNLTGTIASGYAPTFDLTFHERIINEFESLYKTSIPDSALRTNIQDAIGVVTTGTTGLASEHLPWPLGKPEGIAESFRFLFGHKMTKSVYDWLHGESPVVKAMRVMNVSKMFSMGQLLSSRIEAAARANIFEQAFRSGMLAMHDHMLNTVRMTVDDPTIRTPDGYNIAAAFEAEFRMGRIRNITDFDLFMKKNIPPEGRATIVEKMSSLAGQAGAPQNDFIRTIQDDLDTIQEKFSGNLGDPQAAFEINELFDRAMNAAGEVAYKAFDEAMRIGMTDSEVINRALDQIYGNNGTVGRQNLMYRDPALDDDVFKYMNVSNSVMGRYSLDELTDNGTRYGTYYRGSMLWFDDAPQRGSYVEMVDVDVASIHGSTAADFVMLDDLIEHNFRGDVIIDGSKPVPISELLYDERYLKLVGDRTLMKGSNENVYNSLSSGDVIVVVDSGIMVSGKSVRSALAKMGLVDDLDIRFRSVCNYDRNAVHGFDIFKVRKSDDVIEWFAMDAASDELPMSAMRSFGDCGVAGDVIVRAMDYFGSIDLGSFDDLVKTNIPGRAMKSSYAMGTMSGAVERISYDTSDAADFNKLMFAKFTERTNAGDRTAILYEKASGKIAVADTHDEAFLVLHPEIGKSAIRFDLAGSDQLLEMVFIERDTGLAVVGGNIDLLGNGAADVLMDYFGLPNDMFIIAESGFGGVTLGSASLVGTNYEMYVAKMIRGVGDDGQIKLEPFKMSDGEHGISVTFSDLDTSGDFAIKGVADIDAEEVGSIDNLYGLVRKLKNAGFEGDIRLFAEDGSETLRNINDIVDDYIKYRIDDLTSGDDRVNFAFSINDEFASFSRKSVEDAVQKISGGDDVIMSIGGYVNHKNRQIVINRYFDFELESDGECGRFVLSNLRQMFGRSEMSILSGYEVVLRNRKGINGRLGRLSDLMSVRYDMVAQYKPGGTAKGKSYLVPVSFRKALYDGMIELPDGGNGYLGVKISKGGRSEVMLYGERPKFGGGPGSLSIVGHNEVTIYVDGIERAISSDTPHLTNACMELLNTGRIPGNVVSNVIDVGTGDLFRGNLFRMTNDLVEFGPGVEQFRQNFDPFYGHGNLGGPGFDEETRIMISDPIGYAATNAEFRNIVSDFGGPAIVYSTKTGRLEASTFHQFAISKMGARFEDVVCARYAPKLDGSGTGTLYVFDTGAEPDWGFYETLSRLLPPETIVDRGGVISTLGETTRQLASGGVLTVSRAETFVPKDVSELAGRYKIQSTGGKASKLFFNRARVRFQRGGGVDVWNDLVGVFTVNADGNMQFVWTETMKNPFHRPLIEYSEAIGGDMMTACTLQLRPNGIMLMTAPTHQLVVDALNHIRDVFGLSYEYPIKVNIGMRRNFVGNVGDFFNVNVSRNNRFTHIDHRIWETALNETRNMRLQQIGDEFGELRKSLDAWRGIINSRGGRWKTYTMSPSARAGIVSWSERMRSQMLNDVELSMYYASSEVNRILFDYTMKGNWEEMLRYYAPFSTWQLRNPLFWAQAYANNPNLIRLTVNAVREMEVKRRQMNLSSRFKGTTGFELAEDFGPLDAGYYAFKVSPLIPIFQQGVAPYELPEQQGYEAPGLLRALQVLTDAGKLAGINPWPWVTFGMEKMGITAGGSSNNYFLGPLQRVYELVMQKTGRMEPDQTLFGTNPVSEFMISYNANRRIAEMEAEGIITHDEAIDAINNPESSIYKQAYDDVVKTTWGSNAYSLLSPFSVKYATPGELRIRSTLAQDDIIGQMNDSFVETYGVIFQEPQRQAVSKIMSRYNKLMKGIMPWEDRYKQLMQQRSVEIQKALGDSGIPTRGELDPSMLHMYYRGNPSTNLKTTQQRLRTLEPTVEMFTSGGKIDWDGYYRATDAFLGNIGRISDEIGVETSLLEYMSYRYHNSTPEQIAYKLYRMYVNEAWDTYNNTKTGAPGFQRALDWSLEQQYIRDVSIGFTEIEAENLREINRLEWIRDGIPYEWRRMLIEDYIGDVSLTRFSKEVADIMGVSGTDLFDIIDQLNYDLPGMFGERSQVDVYRDSIMEYYSNLVPWEKSKVREFLGVESMSNLSDEQIIKAWMKLNSEFAKYEYIISEGALNPEMGLLKIPAPDNLTEQEIADMNQLRIDSYRYNVKVSQGIDAQWTSIMEKYLGDPTSAKSRFWNELGGYILDSSAYDDSFLGQFLDATTRGIMNFTDQQYAEALSYFREHIGDLVNTELSEIARQHPDWFESALSQKAMFTESLNPDIEGIRFEYYSIPYKQRSSWKSKNRASWLLLEEYLNRRLAEEVKYPEYMYFFRTYDYKKFFGSLTPDEIDPGRASKLSEQLMSAYNARLRAYEGQFGGDDATGNPFIGLTSGQINALNYEIESIFNNPGKMSDLLSAYYKMNDDQRLEFRRNNVAEYEALKKYWSLPTEQRQDVLSK